MEEKISDEGEGVVAKKFGVGNEVLMVLGVEVVVLVELGESRFAS